MRPGFGGIRGRLVVSSEVAGALAGGDPVVALESTLISHGLPRPANLEVARSTEAAVRESGAVPATVAISGGRLLVGLDDDALVSLATAAPDTVMKASRPTLAAALDSAGWAATTVSATMIAANAAGIEVFATGGIGGVHRRVRTGDVALDISSDLDELGRTPMVVVCAGPKSILDVAATLEVLETRGVPVVTIGLTELPGFLARSAGIPSPLVAVDDEAAVSLIRTHLGLGLGGGILVCVPVPDDDALPDASASAAIEQALGDAIRAGVRGPALTPWLLARIAALTGGASVRANAALIINNARVAGRLAVLLGTGRRLPDAS